MSTLSVIALTTALLSLGGFCWLYLRERARSAADARFVAGVDAIRRFNASCDSSRMELDASPARPEPRPFPGISGAAR